MFVIQSADLVVVYEGHRYFGGTLEFFVGSVSGQFQGLLRAAENSFDFVSYIYLKCGLPLIDQSQLQLAEVADRGDIRIGQALFIRADGREFCGIAASDGALVCRDENGYIVMRYLDMMDVETIYGSTAAEVEA